VTLPRVKCNSDKKWTGVGIPNGTSLTIGCNSQRFPEFFITPYKSLILSGIEIPVVTGLKLFTKG